MAKCSFYSTTPEFEAYYNSLSPEEQKDINDRFHAALSGPKGIERYLKREAEKESAQHLNEAVSIADASGNSGTLIVLNEDSKPICSESSNIIHNVTRKPERPLAELLKDPKFLRYLDKIDLVMKEAEKSGIKINRNVGIEIIRKIKAPVEFRDAVIDYLTFGLDSSMESSVNQNENLGRSI